ncbi:MAG: type IV toxin-antitoxin system AbiEi family antitoxin domain-containing protein [Humibacillus sp.]|nr:type IV toxin-antitoxin system AbiEi family antitoxin domain-containing protein [Humibacillus sp.]MDN5778746.1 type IV toxin-antitoxin system AbiEi family antitoxin domain-containing protein [Humibacillus sp.]
MDEPAVDRILQAQGGVIARRQVLASGLDDDDIERMLRRREWARVHPGVYVDHTGEPTWIERAWAAILFHWPAALAGPSALRVHGVRSAGGVLSSVSTEPIHVVVAHERRVWAPAGVLLTRRRRFDDQVQLRLSPPRLRIDEALLDVAAGCRDEPSAVAVLADACQEGRTTPARLRATLRSRGRLRHRRTLLTVLDDVADGALSAFERRYLTQVERRHGLPTARRQMRVATRGGITYRDVEYTDFATVVELDGRLAHAGSRRRWDDFDRDIESAISGQVTVRLGWGHVLEPCRTAGQVVRLLRSRGWAGSPVSCRPGCPLEVSERAAG